MNPSSDTEDSAMGRPRFGGAELSHFERSRSADETIITWLERLCDEHNAPVAQK